MTRNIVLLLSVFVGCGEGVNTDVYTTDNSAEESRAPCGPEFIVTVTATERMQVTASVEDITGELLPAHVVVLLEPVVGLKLRSVNGCSLHIEVGDLSGKGALVDMDFDQPVQLEDLNNPGGKKSFLGDSETAEISVTANKGIDVKVTPLDLLLGD